MGGVGDLIQMVQLDLSYAMPLASFGLKCGSSSRRILPSSSDVKEDIVPDYPLVSQTATHLRVAEELADDRARVYLRLTAPTRLCRLLFRGGHIGRRLRC